MPTKDEVVVETSTLDYVIMGLKLLFAFSPIIALGFVLMSAFETKEEEDLKRRKKGDFEMEGHGE